MKRSTRQKKVSEANRKIMMTVADCIEEYCLSATEVISLLSGQLASWAHQALKDDYEARYDLPNLLEGHGDEIEAALADPGVQAAAEWLRTHPPGAALPEELEP